MESLFKFVLERPAVKIEEEKKIDLSQNSDFQAKLANAIGKEDVRDISKSESSKYTKSKNFIKELSSLKTYDQIKELKQKLNSLSNNEAITQNEMKELVKEVFGGTANQAVKSSDFVNTLKNLKDSVIAIKYLPEEHKLPIEELTNAIRDLELINKFASDKSFPGSGAVLKKYRKRVLKLPSHADFKSILATREKVRKEREEAARKRLKEKKESIKKNAALYKKLKKAVEEITGLDHELLESTPQRAHQGFIPPKVVQPLNVFKEELQKLNTLGQLKILNTRTNIETHKKTVPNIEDNLKDTELNYMKILNNKNNFFVGAKIFKPNTSLSTMFRFLPSAEGQLSSETRNILKERKLSITEMAIDKIIAVLKAEMKEISNELGQLTQGQQTKSYKRMGNALIVTNSPKVTLWGYQSTPAIFEDLEFELIDTRVPASKGEVTPSGIADLILVKQQLKGYQGKDVAHIENVLKGEKKERTHRSYKQTVEETSVETEVTSMEERELESTDRFELSREASKTIKTEASLKAGLTISGSYGPTVKFSASAEGAMSTSKEEATKTASKFSKDVTQKSVEKLTERILERSKRVVTNEVEETNSHSLDNTGGGGHVSGVYQWVEKVYEAQMYNYGVRMMFDFMIPEPGAYIIEAMQKAHASVLEIEKPIKFPLQPNNINDVNYNFWIHRYGAKGINPPPEEYITKSYNYNAGEGSDKTDFQNSGIINIDDGYVAVQASTGLVCTQWNSDRIVDIVIGRRTHRFSDDGNWMWITNLDNETESIPIGFITNDLADIAVGVEIKCRRTNKAYHKWQLDTHTKLMEAYQVKMTEYEEKLAELELQAGVEIEGKNPALNLEIMKDELKKNCISILTEQHYDLFDAIQSGTNGLPQIDLYQNEAEGPYVRFFEQAFEWEHITWLTYPYFWGRKNKWEEKIGFDDPDPLFNQFIKAGYCRAVVPVRPSFEGAVDHFMTFGEIWAGGPLPTISSDLYLPIAEELAERLDQPGDEIPQGDAWEVRVPTNLVKLRSDDALPEWEKDEQENWIEKD